MPELAEVEYGRRIAEATLVGERIAQVWCDDDRIVFDGVLPSAVVSALTGATVLAARRWGKHLWLELDRRPWPLFHFGMTGAFRSPQAAALELASSPRGGEPPWPPPFAKIRIETEGGRALVMTNKRRLGRIRLRQDPRAEPPISTLGFDPLLEPPTPEVFGASLRARRAPVKAVLLDQRFAAGVGNWLADEILYAARVDPRRRASALSAAEAAAIRDAMVDIVGRAVEVDADKRRFPRSWLFHRRWGRPEGAETIDGHSIDVIDVAGRSTAWVPAIQR